ncbi:MAG TPA: Gfo/Idh/MocA family oxidoreductase [Jatrophihabitans sp.]|nr:Gfo/Idh/MocA family oxidoreductase [Jatrophihabitans sp.]
MTEPLRLGVLGAARITARAIVPAAEETGTRLVAVAARDRVRAEDFAERHGVERVLDSYADVIADAEVEAIYNPLANALHAPWNLAAIEARKPVLTEKPFASNADEAAEVRDAAAKADVVVLEGFHYLFHPVTQRLHELLDSGELGELERVEATMVIPAPSDDDPRWSLPLAGGALMDLGCYNLHAHRMLAPWGGGEPTVLEARGEARADKPGVDEWLDVNLEFPNGARGSARCNMNGDVERMTLRIAGSRGFATAANFVLPQRDDRIFVSTPVGDRVEQLGTRLSYTYMLEAFIARVRDGEPLPIDADDAVATMTLIDACYRAAGFEPRPRYAPD